MDRFFRYCPNCGFDTFKTAEEAEKDADGCVDHYRDFRPGDTVILREIEPDPLEHYTGRACDFRIGYVTDFSQMPGFVVFSLLPYEGQEGDLAR